MIDYGKIDTLREGGMEDRVGDVAPPADADAVLVPGRGFRDEARHAEGGEEQGESDRKGEAPARHAGA